MAPGPPPWRRRERHGPGQDDEVEAALADLANVQPSTPTSTGAHAEVPPRAAGRLAGRPALRARAHATAASSRGGP